MVDLSGSSILHMRLRPHTQALILRQIARVFATSEADYHTLNPIEPCVNPDAAQRLLIGWGVTIPWCWAVWNEERCIDYHVIIHLVRAWSFNIYGYLPPTVCIDCHLALSPR